MMTEKKNAAFQPPFHPISPSKGVGLLSRLNHAQMFMKSRRDNCCLY